MITVDETELDLAVRSTGGANCVDDGKSVAVQLRPDDSILYRAGSIAGTLHKV
ncbi:hypothetical protein ACQPW1_45105 [Nocardia sp. CA-128927]|uniref:hypothetical protein n=1 Tax=Nocardia sp. CA-128927 TaxID=3239975 RepID=UPI003D99FDCD